MQHNNTKHINHNIKAIKDYHNLMPRSGIQITVAEIAGCH